MKGKGLTLIAKLPEHLRRSGGTASSILNLSIIRRCAEEEEEDVTQLQVTEPTSVKQSGYCTHRL